MSIEYLIYSFLLLIVGMCLVLFSIKIIFETKRVLIILPFLAFSMGILGLIPFLISDLSINKLMLDFFIFLGFFFLFISFKTLKKGGRQNE